MNLSPAATKTLLRASTSLGESDKNGKPTKNGTSRVGTFRSDSLAGLKVCTPIEPAIKTCTG
jgi:hypothetical protein